MIAPASPLMEFLHSVYVPSKLDLGSGQIEQLEVSIRKLDAFASRPKISDLSEEMICKFLRDCLGHGLAPATVNSKRAQILALWRCAWKKKLHPEQPRDIPRCREPRRIPRAWTAEEIQLLVNHAATLSGVIGKLPRAWWWSTLILVCWETGVRVGAARELRVEDFHPRGPALLVRSESQKTLLGQCLPLSCPTATALAEHLLAPQRELIWPWPHCDRWLFVCFRRIVETVGLEARLIGHDLFYRLRRSNLSYVAREAGLEVARQQAGHTSAATTIKHYIDPRIANVQRAVDMLPQIEIH